MCRDTLELWQSCRALKVLCRGVSADGIAPSALNVVSARDTKPAVAPFLRLDDVLLPPPFTSLAAIALVLGFVAAARIVQARIFARASALAFESSLVAVIALAGTIIHALAWVGVALLPILRGVGVLLVVLGAIHAARAVRAAPVKLRAWQAVFRSLPATQKAAVVMTGAIIACLALTALAPVSDPDSTDYHVGVPLEWLREGHLTAPPTWFTLRLIGIGEMVSLLGLACGTDCLGACTQLFAIPIAIGLVRHVAQAPSRRVVGALIVATLPVLVQLSAQQKPQLLPAAAVALAGVMVAEARVTEWRDLVAIATCLAFALGSKQSFALTVAPVAVLALASAWSQKSVARALTALVATALVVIGPFMLQRVLAFGDPLSPQLERLKASPDPLVLGFADYLRAFGSDHSLKGIALSPLRLLLPATPIDFQATIGLGVFAGVLAIKPGVSSARKMLGLAAVAAVLLAMLAQQGARYYIEVYLWGALALLAAKHERHRWMLPPLLVQSVAVLGASAIGVAILTTGALSPGLRDRMLTRHAQGYVEAKQLDAVLAPNDVILFQSRTHAYARRPLVPFDAWGYTDAAGPDTPLAAAARRAGRTGGATVLYGYQDVDADHPLVGCVTAQLPFSDQLPVATRNPLRSSTQTYPARLYRLDFTLPTCKRD
jgi:hypothetical protein